MGVGPPPALPSALLGVMAWGLEERLGLPPISEQAKLLADVERLWMGLGLALGLWSLWSLRPSDRT